MTKSLLPILSLCLLVAPSVSAEPLKVGEYQDHHLESPHPYPAGAPGEPAYLRYRISHPGATYISVHLAWLDLAEGDVLAMFNPRTGMRYEYRGRGVMQAGTFWATHLKGDDVIIELQSQNPEPGFGFVIDRYAHGIVSLGPWPEAAPGTDAICGADDKDNAICYQSSHPSEYNASRAVARLLISGSALCTGSLISCQNHFITNQHCISTQAAATNTDYEFMAEAPTCGSGNCQLCYPGTVFRGANLIQANGSLDFAFIQLTNGDPQATYGYLEIDNRSAVVNEQIFIPQHPSGRAKELGIFSTHSSDASGRCEVYTTSAAPCSGGPGDVGYYCDTEGGSSGSPVLAVSSMKMIALHHCANCPNRGVPITAVMGQIGSQLPNCNCPSITVSPSSLPNATVGVAYSQTITASGGTGPYTFAVTAGSLPGGLSLSSGGVLSGTPTASGSFSFTVTATDTTGCTGNRAYSLTVNPASCGSIVLSPANLPDGTVGASYSQTITASGGVGPYTFAVTAGQLPPGLSLSSAGTISGTPTTAATSSFTVTAADAQGCTGAAAYQIRIVEGIDYLVGQGLAQSNPNRVRMYDASGAATAVDLLAYSAGAWGVNVGAGDINGGSHAEVLTGPGPGPVFGPQVRGFDRAGIGMAKVNYYAYGTLRYGVNVAALGLDQDAFREVATGPGPGEVFGPHVRGWNFDGVAVNPINRINFFAYNTLRFGVNVVGGDVDGDGFAELLSGPGPGPVFGAQIRAFNFDGAAISAIAKINFFAFTTGAFGANLTGGEVDGDAYQEIVAAPGPGRPFGAVIAGFDYDATAISSLPGFTATPFNSTYGARVGAGDVSLDGSDDAIAGPGPDPATSSRVKAFRYTGTGVTLLPGSFTPFGTSCCGNTVGAGAFGY